MGEIRPVAESPPVEDQYYILATSSHSDNRTRVLKHGDSFAVFDLLGDIRPAGLHEEGLYHRGTRFLSRWQLRLGAQRPLLLNSTVSRDNTVLSVDLTNPDMYQYGDMLIPRGTLHMLRSKFLWQGTCYESLMVRNHGLVPVEFRCSLDFAADFADIFEVRGVRRAARGTHLEGQVRHQEVRLRYQGLDRMERELGLRCEPNPSELSPIHAGFYLTLAPQEERGFQFALTCSGDHAPSRETANDGQPATLTRGPALSYNRALVEIDRSLVRRKAEQCEIETSSEQFNMWLERSISDLYMMITEGESGPYPYAGIPWFSTYFGRDGIITALEMLWANPSVARGVLRYLADTQALQDDPNADAEPGKVLHESREGEMATLGEVPFARYYGSVDATPLFVILAGDFYLATRDLSFIKGIWGNLLAALQWIDKHGDLDGDGFVEYQRRSSNGLLQQGWKDSFDSVFHEDGSAAGGPIALCEVQGYVYAARRRGALLARALGDEALAARLESQAAYLRRAFEETFWLPGLSTYALALDGDKEPCRVRTSNPGHALWAGIVAPDRARAVAETLLSEDLFSGWGVRTVAASEARYNPMSYHNGSVWPHDNALLGSGLARYGLKQGVVRIFNGLFEASRYLDLCRMPELFCGFERRPGSGPTLYPVACAPQAWAAGSIFLLLQACLGLTIDATQHELRFIKPALPEFLEHLYIRNLQVGQASVDLSIIRYPGDVGVNVLRREGQVDVVVVK